MSEDFPPIVLARFAIKTLLLHYKATDPNQIKRVVREEFTQEHLDIYQAAIGVLDGNGRLG